MTLDLWRATSTEDHLWFLLVAGIVGLLLILNLIANWCELRYGCRVGWRWWWASLSKFKIKLRVERTKGVSL